MNNRVGYRNFFPIAMLAGDQKRNTWESYGYPENLEFENFFVQFRRNPFARAAVMKTPEKCWSTYPKIFDYKAKPGDKKGEPVAGNTEFERDMQYLIDEKDFFQMVFAMDYRQRVGRYGGLVIIAKENASDTKEKLSVRGPESIIAFRPVYESQITVGIIDDDFGSENFGNPKDFNFSFASTPIDDKELSSAKTLHHSRVFVFSEGADDGTIFGVSILESGYNCLLDMTKVIGAAAEGFFKNAKMRLHFNVVDEEVASNMVTAEGRAPIEKQIRDFSVMYDNEIMTMGMEVNNLQATITDPTQSFDIALSGFIASIDVPKTVLIGFETGERSSSENANTYDEYCNSRRENTLTPVLKKLIKHLIKIGAVRPPKNGISIVWDDLAASSDKEKLELGEIMMRINETHYRAGGSGQIFSDDEIRESTGFDPDGNDIDIDRFTRVDSENSGDK